MPIIPLVLEEVDFLNYERYTHFAVKLFNIYTAWIPTPMNQLPTLFPFLSLVPVVVIEHAKDAVPLAEALLEGGITSIEITLRTEAGLHAIEQVAKHVPDIINGAGTITSTSQMQAAKDAGAVFQVSPGVTVMLAAYAQKHAIAWLPGVTNASNIMTAMEHGMRCMKLFPASLSGGVPMLKQFASVFPHLRFCPTGGIDEGNMNDYGALPSVFAIGGSWLTPKELIASKDWKGIAAIAKRSVAALQVRGV
jgi:2-dehydro-3-deoxyphosphogluconate aldolase / (4S)-4-hydroxy-2-oxoglutarate aldolase